MAQPHHRTQTNAPALAFPYGRVSTLAALVAGALTLGPACSNDGLQTRTGQIQGPSRVDFGELLVGDTGVESATLRATVTGGRIRIESAELSSDVVDLQWIGGPVALEPGETVELIFGWSPESVGTLSETVTIATSQAPTALVIELVGTAVDIPGCEDGNPCTNDFWDPIAGACGVENNTSGCDDGITCTVDDHCESGTCVGEASTDPQCNPVVCDVGPQVGDDPFSGRWFEEAWSAGPDDTWLVGVGGLAIHSDGSDWTVVPTCTDATLFSVWGNGPGDVWAVGSGSTVLHWRGSQWQEETAPIQDSRNFWGVWGDGSDVWIVGDSLAMRRTAAGWEDLSAGLNTTLYSVWGHGGTVWAAGDGGTIVRWNGASFEPMSTPTAVSLFSIRGGSNGSVWAVGQGGVVLQLNGTWNTIAAGTSAILFSVWGDSDQDLWIAGDGGVIRHYDGISWTDHSHGPLARVYALWGSGAGGQVWAAGSGGVLRHWSGGGWTTEQ